MSLQSRTFVWLIPLALLLLAATTRIIGAGHYPLWTDEGWGEWSTSVDLATSYSNIYHDRQPPLYFVALNVWRGFTGDSRIALRYMSILAGLLTVAATYRLTVDAFGRTAGAYAVLLLAVLPIAVYYSQELRHYGWFTLGVALMWLCFLRFLRRPSRSLWLAYVLSITFTAYVLYFVVLPLAIQLFVGLFLWRPAARQRRWLVSAWAVSGLLYLPWVIVVITVQWTMLSRGIAGFPGTYTLALENLLPLAELLLGTQAALTGGLYVLGAIRGWPRLSLRPAARLAHWSVLLGGAVLMLGILVLSLRFNFLAPRTLVFLAPLFTVMCGVGLSLIQQRTALVLAGALVVVTLATPTIIQPRLDYAAAIAPVQQNFSPGDLIVLETGWDDNSFAYELGRLLPQSEIIRTIARADIYVDDKDMLPEILPRLAEHPRVWVIQWLQAPQIMPYLETPANGYQSVFTTDLPVNHEYRDRFGDSIVKIALYERPDTAREPQNFGDLLNLQDAQVVSSARAGDTLHIDLWWSALEPLPLDYSVGVFVLDSNGVVRAEHNAPPGNNPTTQWQPDQLMFDRHTFNLPADLPPGDYSIAVKVYWYGDQQPLSVNSNPLAIIGQLAVQ